MTKKEFNRFFVNQYSLLEKDFIEATQYVAFESDNYQTYSNVFSKLLLQTGSEVDNILKTICEIEGRTNISEYANVVLNKYPGITKQKVIVRENQQIMIPYQGWCTDEPSKSLKFWDAYNTVKHDRIRYYKMGTMGNVSLALAGLYVLNIYFCDELYRQNQEEFSSEPEYESEIFILDNWVNHFRPSKAKSEVPLMDDERGELI